MIQTCLQNAMLTKQDLSMLTYMIYVDVLYYGYDLATEIALVC